MALGGARVLQSKRPACERVLHSRQRLRAIEQRSIPSYRQAKTTLGATQQST
jgi:hypothetical protein